MITLFVHILDKILHPDRDESSDEAKGVSNSPDAAAGPKLPHIIDIKNLATRSNDSVHDDTYSELTFTDTAVENETNNSGDSVAPSGMSVASSSASSLPSLKSVSLPNTIYKFLLLIIIFCQSTGCSNACIKRNRSDGNEIR